MKKYISIILLALFAVVNSAAQNVVSISSGKGVPGDIVTVDLALQNSDEVTAVEVVIPLVNKQLTYVDGSCVINSERANGHQLNAAVVDGALRIYIYNISLAPLNGNEGLVASFNLKLGKSPAEYPLQPQVVLSDAAGKALTASVTDGAVTILAPQIEVVTQSVDFGHVPIMAQYTKTLTLRNSGTLPLEVTGIEFSAPEFTATATSFTIAAGATKSISVAYSPTKRGAIEENVSITSNAVNGKATATLIADPYSVNELHSSRAEGIAGEEVTVELHMNNMEPIVGLQTSFELPDGIEYVDGSFAPAERAASHTAMASVNDKQLTLILYSSKNTPMEGNDGVVATFRLRLDCNSGSYKITPQNTVLSNATVENMVSAVSGNYIVVKSPNISGNSELDFGKTPITEIAKADYSIKNSGKATLVVNGVAFLSTGYRVANELPLSIEPGATGVLNVEFTPTTEGEHSTTMNIYSNDPDEKLKTVRLSGTVYEPNNLTFAGENLLNGNYVVSIGLDNYTGIVAVQMDIHFMPGMTTSNDYLKVTQRLAGHSCSVTKIDEDTYRFIAFSFNNNSIAGNEGKLFDLTFVPNSGVEYKNAPIVIDNVILSSADASNYTSQLSLNTTAAYSHYYVRFMCEGELVGECFQKVGSAVVYPQMPERTGHSFHWELEGGNQTLAYPIDIAGNADNMLYTNAYCTDTTWGDEFNGWYVLFDGDDGTFFHSEYASNKTSVDGLHHYLRVDLGAGNEIEKFSFTYATRRGTIDGSPTKIVVEGSNVADGGYEEIAVLTGMPTSNSTYSSDTLGNGNSYRYIRFRVTETRSNSSPSGHPFFYISEFGMTRYVDATSIPEIMPARDVVIEGVFTVNNYAVTYKVDGVEYAVDSVAYGSEVVLREHPVKEGHTFGGWSEAPTTMSAEDITIEGVFTVNTYNVIYKVDGEEYKVVPVVYGSEVTLIEVPIKEGYIFGGWSEAPVTMPAEDVIIEGSFAVNTYNVIYKVDGEEYKVVPVVYGSEIVVIEAPVKEGHTFSGWSEAPATMPAEDVVIEGTFAVNYYTVTYIVDGEVYATDSIAYGSEIVLLDEPTKEGHAFSGWSEALATMPANDVTIEGSFTVNTYSIIYKVDGEEYKVVPVVYGSEIALIDAPIKEGHTFSGWSEAPATMPAEDVTIEGSFAVNYYTVTYLVDGEVYKVESIAYGSEIVLRDEPTKEGHTFSGWSEAPATMPAEDVTIEGSFAVNYYTVTYLVDGEVYATETVAYGSEITLIDEPTKEGYTFSGWSEAPATMPAEDVVIEGSFSPITTINGVVYDAEDLIIYNLRGERIIDVDELEQGFYIINGKKVWVK